MRARLGLLLGTAAAALVLAPARVGADEDGGLVDGVDASVLGADPRALLVLLGSSLTRLRSAEMRPTRERHALETS